MPRGVDPRKPALFRFWSKVGFLDNGCWEWKGEINDSGYGIFQSKGRAHRFAYEALTGMAIPEGLQIDHLCRNRKCVNPSHLDVVTGGENLRRSPLLWSIWLKLHAKYRNKTHCPQGHPYDEKNTYVYASGGRQCRMCHRDAARERRLKKRGEE